MTTSPLRLVVLDLDDTVLPVGPVGRLPLADAPRAPAGTREALAALAPGRHVVLLCPGDAAGQAARLAAAGLDRSFDEIRFEAPGDLADRIVSLGRLIGERGLEPWQAVVIGDRLDEEIAAGRAVGAWTVRVLGGQARFASSRGELDRPHYSVGTLEALPAVIEEIEREIAEAAEDPGAGADRG